MANLSGFDANNVEPNQPFEPIPADDYVMVITESEEQPTKAKTGSFIKLTLEVIEGDYRGRKVFDRLNLNNPNTQAVEIAQRTLSSICRAVGVMMPDDSSELHDKPMLVKVAVNPGDAQYGPSNEIKGYSATDGGGSKPAASSGSTPPWKK